MTTPVEVPDIGDFSDIPIIEVHVGTGDTVDVDDPLITLESDKATMDVPAPAAGAITDVLVKVGDTVSQGTRIAMLQPGDGALKRRPARRPAGARTGRDRGGRGRGDGTAARSAAPTRAGESPAGLRRQPRQPVPAPRRSRPPMPHAGPGAPAGARARRGPGHRVGNGTEGPDHQGRPARRVVARQRRPRPHRPAAHRHPRSPRSGLLEVRADRDQAVVPDQEGLGPFLHRSWLNVPHVTQNDEADITELDAYRKELDTAAKAEGYRVTLLAFLVKAAVSALRQFPEFNSSLSPEKDSLILKSYYNIGIAVDTPDGLVVPVVKDADREGITELSKEFGTISAKARDGKLSPTDLQGGTFTISSLGGIGGTSFTPIVNAPEVAILGVVRSKMTPGLERFGVRTAPDACPSPVVRPSRRRRCARRTLRSTSVHRAGRRPSTSPPREVSP